MEIGNYIAATILSIFAGSVAARPVAKWIYKKLGWRWSEDRPKTKQ